MACHDIAAHAGNNAAKMHVIDDGETVHKGSTAVAVFFLGVFVIGLLLAFIAVVAWGVRFGTESADPPALKDGRPMVPVARPSGSGRSSTSASPTGTS